VDVGWSSVDNNRIDSIGIVEGRGTTKTEGRRLTSKRKRQKKRLNKKSKNSEVVRNVTLGANRA